MALVSVVKWGGEAESIRECTKKAIDLIGGMSAFIHPGQRVLVKPNFVAPITSAVTDFDVITAVIQEIKAVGATPFLGKSTGFEFDPSATFRFLKVYEFAYDNGIDLIDFETDSYVEKSFDHPFIHKVLVARSAVEADAIVNVPRMKSHKLTTLSMAIKNCFGMLAPKSRRIIHAAGIHNGIAALYELFHPAINVMDGLIIPAEGAIYGAKAELSVITASEDMLSLDFACAPMLGANPMEIEHLAIASHGSSPSFDIVGDEVTPVNIFGLRNTAKRKLYRAIYQSLYAFDEAASRLGAPTIIPWFHTKFGIHPVVNWQKCTGCGDCIKVCQVEAIDLSRQCIDYSRCSRLRCMACVEACPKGVITAASSRLARMEKT